MGPYIHPTAVVGGDAQWRQYLEDDNIAERTELYAPQLGEGVRIGPLSQVDAGCIRPTILGPDVQVMGHVHVGHGAQIGEGCDIASGTVIAGEVTIGRHVKVGIGALISPFVTVGDYARIGAGAVVIRDVPAHECWAGNPARRLYSYCRACHVKLELDEVWCPDCMARNADLPGPGADVVPFPGA